MRITNGKVFNFKGFFELRDLFISGEYICNKEEEARSCETKHCEEKTYDAKGAYIIPGLIDIHLHGCMGVDFCDSSEESLWKISEYELRQGITAFCPATMTFGEGRLKKIMEEAALFTEKQQKLFETKAKYFGAEFVGINMEGPFISEKKCGAQSKKDICLPDFEMFMRLQSEAKGMIKLVDLAPELEGAMDFIRRVSSMNAQKLNTQESNIQVSIAHTNADYATACEAIECGANHVTHLYNAMPPFHHRDPGVVGAARDMGCDVELICDGIHVHPSMVRSTYDMFGREHVILISDSMEATGLTDGMYQLGGQDVSVKGRLATIAGTDTIAGSVTNLMNCMRCAVKDMGVSLEAAVQSATINPARSIGIDNLHGSLEAGRYANIIILDENLEIVEIIYRGNIMSE